MLPAPSFDDILSRAPVQPTASNPGAERLTSIVFANPTSFVWRDLHTNRAFLDVRTGDDWDLFFAGMSGYKRMDTDAEQLWDPFWRENWQRYLNPQRFKAIERRVVLGQQRAAVPSSRLWQYSGDTDLVSFMCYARDPDWASLVYCRIDDSEPSARSLGEIAEGLRRWQDGEVDPDLTPGEFQTARVLPDLGAALKWSAAAVGSGIVGDFAYDLLKLLMRS